MKVYYWQNKTDRRACPSASMFTENPIWTDLDSNLGRILRGRQLTAWSLGTAHGCCISNRLPNANRGKVCLSHYLITIYVTYNKYVAPPHYPNCQIMSGGFVNLDL